MFLFCRRRVISDSRRQMCLPGGFRNAGDFAGEGEFAEGDARDAKFSDVAARAAAIPATVAHAVGRGIFGQLLELLLRGEECLVGRGRIDEDGFELGAHGLVFFGQALALLVAFDGGSFRHGGSWLKTTQAAVAVLAGSVRRKGMPRRRSSSRPSSSVSAEVTKVMSRPMVFLTFSTVISGKMVKSS